MACAAVLPASMPCQPVMPAALPLYRRGHRAAGGQVFAADRVQRRASVQTVWLEVHGKLEQGSLLVQPSLPFAQPPLPAMTTVPLPNPCTVPAARRARRQRAGRAPVHERGWRRVCGQPGRPHLQHHPQPRVGLSKQSEQHCGGLAAARWSAGGRHRARQLHAHRCTGRRSCVAVGGVLLRLRPAARRCALCNRDAALPSSSAQAASTRRCSPALAFCSAARLPSSPGRKSFSRQAGRMGCLASSSCSFMLRRRLIPRPAPALGAHA